MALCVLAKASFKTLIGFIRQTIFITELLYHYYQTNKGVVGGWDDDLVKCAGSTWIEIAKDRDVGTRNREV